MKLENSEIILRKGRCNHRHNPLDPLDWVGGQLFLTNHRLVFHPHSLNFRTEEESIPLENIIRIEAEHSDFISNKMTVYMVNGSSQEFRVAKRRNWIRDIERNTGKSLDRDERLNIDRIDGLKRSEKSFSWFIVTAFKLVLLAIIVGAIMFIFQSF